MSVALQSLLVALVAANVGWVVAHHRISHSGAARDVEGLLRPLVAAAGAWVVGVLVVGLFDQITFFEAMSFVYLAAVLTTPFVALAVLTAEVRGTAAHHVPPLTRGAHVCSVALLLLAPLGLYVSHVETNALEVHDELLVLPPDVKGDVPMRVGIISDIQTVEVSSRERRAVDLLLAEQPDIVLIAGDLFQGTPGQWERTRADYHELLTRLAAVPGGALVVGGDVDQGQDMALLLGETGVRFLHNEVAEVVVGDRALRILGLALEPSAEADAALATFVAAPRDGAATVLLAHRPDWADRFGRGPAGVDLVVSGHTHGGQIQLPGIGAIMTMSEVPRHVAEGGLHDLDGQLVYVSTGVGMEQQGAPQIRLGARPSVTLMTLQ